MSIVHVGHIRNAVLSRFGSLVDLSDVQSASKEQLEAARLTRSLAAFAVAELGGIDDTSAAQAVTDGSQANNGIDAVYFDPAEHNCLLVQSQWIHSGNGSVELGDTLKPPAKRAPSYSKPSSISSTGRWSSIKTMCSLRYPTRARVSRVALWIHRRAIDIRPKSGSLRRPANPSE